MPDTLDFYQITCTPTVSPVPLQLELRHRTSWSAGAKHIPGTSARCFRSALIAVCSCCPFQTFFLSLTSYELECLEKHWSNMQSFTLVMSCPDTLNFISWNRIVSRIILALTVVSDDPWRRNMVWSLYHWLVHIIDSGLHFSAGSYQRNSKLDPWLCILLRNGHALWSIRRIPHLYGGGKSWVRLCRARKPVSKPATSSHFSVKLVDIQVYILTQAPESASSLRIWTEMPGRPSTCRGPLFPHLPGLQRKSAPCQCLEMTVNMHVTTEAERSNAHDALSDAASWVMELAWGSKGERQRLLDISLVWPFKQPAV